MDLIQCKVIKGKYGPQVVHEGEFYKVGSFSVDRVRIGKEYGFILEEKPYQDKVVRWANLPRIDADLPEDESLPPKKSGNGLTRIPNEPRKKPAEKPLLDNKTLDRIAEALEGIESLIEILVDMKYEKTSKS